MQRNGSEEEIRQLFWKTSNIKMTIKSLSAILTYSVTLPQIKSDIERICYNKLIIEQIESLMLKCGKISFRNLVFILAKAMQKQKVGQKIFSETFISRMFQDPRESTNRMVAQIVFLMAKCDEKLFLSTVIKLFNKKNVSETENFNFVELNLIFSMLQGTSAQRRRWINVCSQFDIFADGKYLVERVRLSLNADITEATEMVKILYELIQMKKVQADLNNLLPQLVEIAVECDKLDQIEVISPILMILTSFEQLESFESMKEVNLFQILN